MNLVLSIDVSKSNSYAAAFLSNSKSFKFNHSPKGLDALKILLNEIEKVTGVIPKVVLEANCILFHSQ